MPYKQVLTHLALTSRPLERHVSTDVATFRRGRSQTVTSMYPEAFPTSARPANTFLEALAHALSLHDFFVHLPTHMAALAPVPITPAKLVFDLH